MKNSQTVLVILLTIALFNFYCGGDDLGQRRNPSMSPSFSNTDKNPLGLYTAYEILRQTFPNDIIQSVNKPFSKFYPNGSENLYCIISRQFLPSDIDIDNISAFVSEGNTLFIAANYFDNNFLDRFNLIADKTVSLQLKMAFKDSMTLTFLKMTDSLKFQKDQFEYFFYPMKGTVERSENYPYKQIVTTQDGGSGGIIFKHGEGSIIILTDVTAFTNYFLLTKDNYKYLTQLLSYVPKRITKVFWDTYYNHAEKKSEEDFSSFQELMEEPAMKWAFWLFIIGAVLALIIGFIRHQRPVSVKQNNFNNSVDFAKTIARLYLLKKDNKVVALKMIAYCMDQIKNKYYINSCLSGEDLTKVLANKSGMGIESTAKLINTIHSINIQESVSDELLLELNDRIQQFWQKTS